MPFSVLMPGRGHARERLYSLPAARDKVALRQWPKRAVNGGSGGERLLNLIELSVGRMQHNGKTKRRKRFNPRCFRGLCLSFDSIRALLAESLRDRSGTVKGGERQSDEGIA